MTSSTVRETDDGEARLGGFTPQSRFGLLMAAQLLITESQHLQTAHRLLLCASQHPVARDHLCNRNSIFVMKCWFLAGASPKDYAVGIDDAVSYDGKKAAYLRSVVEKPSEFGTLMQNFKANRYLNKRMRFAAAVKSEDVGGWAGLWMRIDGGEKKDSLRFDNMQKRAIKGSTDWQRYQVVLDIPEESTGIFFGILMDGKGQVWLSDVQFEEAPNEPTTDLDGGQEEPGNLDFSDD